VNGKKPKYVTKSKVAQNLFSVPCSLAITTIFNANLLSRWFEEVAGYFDHTAVFALMRYILAPYRRAGRGLGVGFLYLITQRKCCKTSNGAVEGINNKLKLIKRLSYGFRNFENFRVRALLPWYFNPISP